MRAVDSKDIERLKIDTSDPQVYRPIRTTSLLAEALCEVALPGDEILEIGTGNGLVAIAAAKFTPSAQVTASDINPSALETTRLNAEKNIVEIDCVESDLFSAFESRQFDLIASHPPAVPYLPGQSWKMSDGMTVATNGGFDGSDLMLRTIRASTSHLRPGGALLLGLPHWSNARRAFEVLREVGFRFTIARQEKVEFFPFRRGQPSAELVAHIQRLNQQGKIEIDFGQDPPMAPVSIVVAWAKG